MQSAALDEMFHCGTASVQRYQKALLLMEGLSRIVTEQKDVDGINKCKWQYCDTQTMLKMEVPFTQKSDLYIFPLSCRYLVVSYARSELGKKAFVYSAPVAWNILQNDWQLTEFISLSTF